MDKRATSIKAIPFSTCFIAQRKNFLTRKTALKGQAICKGGGQVNEDVQRRFASRTPRIP
jgi:hypothetical protein